MTFASGREEPVGAADQICIMMRIRDDEMQYVA